MFHNTASADVDLFLSDDLKNLRLFLLKRFWFFIPIKIRRIEALRSKLRRTGTKWSSAQLIFDPLR
jgi:hypothetical protein